MGFLNIVISLSLVTEFDGLKLFSGGPAEEGGKETEELSTRYSSSSSLSLIILFLIDTHCFLLLRILSRFFLF